MEDLFYMVLGLTAMASWVYTWYIIYTKVNDLTGNQKGILIYSAITWALIVLSFWS